MKILITDELSKEGIEMLTKEMQGKAIPEQAKEQMESMKADMEKALAKFRK